MKKNIINVTFLLKFRHLASNSRSIDIEKRKMSIRITLVQNRIAIKIRFLIKFSLTSDS